MGKYIFLLLCGIALIAIVYYGSKLLCVYVRKPLVEYCNKKGLSASPWLTLIPAGIGICLLDEYRTLANVEKSMGELLPNFSYLESSSAMLYLYGGIGLIALPMLILLIRARKYFPPVLLIKIICVPLDIFYFVHSCWDKQNFASGRPVSREVYQNGGRYYKTSGQQSGYVEGDTPYSGGSVEEKYQDQYRASQEADSYHTVSTDSGEHYYTGDYVPFVSEGEVTEVRTYDSDYAPMD